MTLATVIRLFREARVAKLVWVGLPLVLALALGAAPLARLAKRCYDNHRNASIHRQWSSERADRRSSKAAPQSGDSAGWLSIPTCGIESLVVYDPTKGNLLSSPCLLRLDGKETAPNVILAHRDMHFRNLGKLERGQKFTFERDNGSVEYEVRDILILEPGGVSACLESIGVNEMVLLTCWPFDFIGAAPRRILFVATRDSTETHSNTVGGMTHTSTGF
jgi:sortase A